ncbi:MAG TPA: hypothetical protein VK148_12905 [Xanthobacteraceae bacterium]|nr:hypothetical protein [Xanthobacteraceae bacterium]
MLKHLAFDSKLTTYDRLDRLDADGITFMTLRRCDTGDRGEIIGPPC